MSLQHFSGVPAGHRVSAGGRTATAPVAPAFRLLALALLAALAACGARVEQPRSIWPDELRLRGAVLLMGDGAPNEAVHRRFLELAGGAEARIVMLELGPDGGQGENSAAAELWRTEGAALSVLRAEAGGSSPAGTSDGGALFDAALLEGATGVWVAATADDGGLPDGALGDAVLSSLREVVDRGGAVAVAGPSGAALAQAMVDGDGGAAAGAGVLPGVLVHATYRGEPDRERMLALLEAQPRLFGVGIRRDAALEVNGRRLRAVTGEVVLMVPAGMGRPSRNDVLRADAQGRGNLADLTAWRREAIERTLPPFPAAQLAPPHVARGTLVIVGGGGIPAEITQLFIEAAGGAQARLVFVPPEEGDSVPNEPGIVRSWRDAGVAGATWIHTKDRSRADGDESFYAPLREATGVWFGGGRQWNFSDSYYGTTTQRLMHEVLARGGVIGGTSAGASIQAEWMARGDPLGNQNILAPGYERGLGFITGVAIDQHFTERSRQANMEELMATYPQLLGIGIDEGTALIVRGSVAEVVGRGRVYFYDRRSDPDAGPVLLSAGSAYHLAERRVVRQADPG